MTFAWYCLDIQFSRKQTETDIFFPQICVLAWRCCRWDVCFCFLILFYLRHHQQLTLEELKQRLYDYQGRFWNTSSPVFMTICITMAQIMQLPHLLPWCFDKRLYCSIYTSNISEPRCIHLLQNNFLYTSVYEKNPWIWINRINKPYNCSIIFFTNVFLHWVLGNCMVNSVGIGLAPFSWK